MLRVHGITESRAARVIWMCRELALPYEQELIHFADDTKHSPQFLHVNPNGKIPAIDDDGFHLSESMAINIYLAKKHSSPLMPDGLHGEALTLQWSFWVVTEVEKPLFMLLFQRTDFDNATVVGEYLGDQLDKSASEERRSVERLQRPFAVLDAQLRNRDYLLGFEFTVADLNVASVLIWALHADLDLSAWPNLQDWLERCTSREAANYHDFQIR
jgi:glutathione S-transferase